MSRATRFLTIILPLLVALAGCGTSTTALPRPHALGAAPLVHLPRDQAAHPGSENEWWYVVGHMRRGSHTFGYEATAFRFSHVRPPGSPAGTPPSTLYRTDIAITDESGHRFYHRITDYFPQSAHLSTSTLSVHVGAINLQGNTPLNMTLRAQLPAGAISLHLRSRRAAMDVGGRGYLRFGSGFTYYYSYTDLASRGSIRVGSRTYRVTGVSWMDHQWGNWTWTSVRRWTWMALQLRNGVQLSVFDFRSRGQRVGAASVLLASGRLRTIRTVTFTPLGSWRSPHTGGMYPSGFVVRIPALKATLTVVPTVRDQEMTDPISAAGSYWEGSARVTGTFHNKQVSGAAYTELTGYAAHQPR